MQVLVSLLAGFIIFASKVLKLVSKIEIDTESETDTSI